MRVSVKTLILMFVFAISNVLVQSTAAAHDADPSHVSHDCSVCISVGLDDDASPPDPAIFDAPMRFKIVPAARPINDVLPVRSGLMSIRARGPPSLNS